MNRSVSPIFVATLALAGCAAPSKPSDAERSNAASLTNTSEQIPLYVVLEGPSAIESLPAGARADDPARAPALRQRIAELESQHAALRPELEALGATVTAELTRLANVIQVLAPETAVARIEHIPGVRRTERVPLLEPSLASAIPVVGAPEVWAKSTPLQGDGITIGIIDSGIDYTHADFGGPGDPGVYAGNDSKIIEPGTFPTAKVVGGWDFVGDDYDATAGNATPEPDPDPLDCLKPESINVSGGHGTHVSGIAAGTGVLKNGQSYDGPYEQTFDPAAFLVAPGVAPRAKLYALKIFGCSGGTNALASALERAVDPNQDGNMSDRLDVLNASLGTSYALGAGVSEELITNLTKAGSMLVAAAGNEGSTFYSVSSPGSIPEVLTVAASADNEIVALTITSPASVAGQYAAVEGGFTTHLLDTGAVSGPLVMAQPANGCGGISNGSELAGKIALIDRGACTFVKKFQSAEAAGAVAVVIVDNQDDPIPFAMSGGDPGSVAIPGVMITKKDGATIKGGLASGVNATLDPAVKFSGIGTELMAGFSSRGPSAADDSLKPEIAAPGFSIDSARVGSGTKARRSQGTSMASPFVAGAAALMRQAQPTWEPTRIKAALVGSVDPLLDPSGAPYPVGMSGSGRLAVERAVDRTVTAMADPDGGVVGMSFKTEIASEPTSEAKTSIIENHGSADVSYDVGVAPARELGGVVVSVSPTKVTVAAGQSATITTTLDFDPTKLGEPGPDSATDAEQYGQPRHFLVEANGRVTLTDTSSAGAQDLVVPYYGIVRAAADRHADPLPECATGESDGPVSVTISGSSAHPNPVVTAFQLGAESPEDPASQSNPARAAADLRAVGVATDLAEADTFDDASAFFGVAVAGDWTTPVRGPYSTVNILIDSDQDGAEDYLIRGEALTKDGPYGDVLAATTYDAKTGQPTASKRFLNMVSADTLDTAPFHNSVIVLSAFLKDIGLSAEHTQFSYLAATQTTEQLVSGDQTDWISFDAAHPALDTAAHGLNARPIYSGSEPVLVDVAGDAATNGELPKLLLLHHNNVAGKRMEIVALANGDTGNLALTSASPESVDAGSGFIVDLTTTNQGTVEAASVKLTATLSGVHIVSAEPTQGSCTTEGGLSCDIGSLAPGAAANVALTVTANETVEDFNAHVDAKITSGIGCETSLSDNKTTASVTITAGSSSRPTLSAKGGCSGCRVGEKGSPRGALMLSLLGLGAALARRRRR
ncbi:MAG: S8 family serine peptidase [Myxococcales bacterium]|nr:S8 family serine peptidase [Myxococcales bacterium]MCB9576692.1 S8 family serine peptidase [Polyangiaceae bacterium]